MTSSSAYQTVSGLFVSKGGTTRIIKKNDEHVWSCRTKFLAGGNFMGFNLGATFTWDDKAYLYPTNNYYFKMQPANAFTKWIFS